MDNEIRRGDIYWARMDSGLGSEQGIYRPVVVVSSDEGNEKCPFIIGIWCTSQYKYGKLYIPITAEGKQARAICSQIVTLDKARLGRNLGYVTEKEMSEIEEGLLCALDINYYDNEHEVDDEEQEEDSENLEEKIADLELELKIARAAYDKLLARVVDMKVDADIASVKTPKVEAPKEEKPPVIVEPPVIAKSEPKVDVNTATETALKKIGWDSVSAKAILANRPYENLEELKSLPGVTKTLFNLVSPRMDCVRVVKEVVPVLTEKVNINTWSVDQITEALGCPKTNAGQIVAHRNKNGEYTDVKEVYEVTGLAKSFVDKYIGCFTVGETEVETQSPELPNDEDVVAITSDIKVNINTMSGPEITKILGCGKTYGGYIVSYRNKNGLYTSKNELFNVPHLGRPFIEKNWGRFILDDVKDEPVVELPVEESKLNINKASLREFMGVGFDKRTAALIVDHRKKFGAFRNVSELSEIYGVTGKILRKLSDVLCVE